MKRKIDDMTESEVVQMQSRFELIYFVEWYLRRRAQGRQISYMERYMVKTHFDKFVEAADYVYVREGAEGVREVVRKGFREGWL